METYHVAQTPYSGLADQLNHLQAQGEDIQHVVPHRQGREVVAEVVSRHHPGPNRRWRVEGANYDDLEATLNQLAGDGYDIFDIIPHREGKEVFAEIVAFIAVGSH